MALPAGTTVINGFALTPDGALYVTPTGSASITGGTITGATISGGTIDGSSLDNGSGIPLILAKSAIPFIGLSSGSVSAPGAITAITALPSAYPNAYCYFPANILATSIAAGWHYCTFSTTTAGTAFLNTYSSGTPTIPASPTAVTDGKGAFTGDTGEEFGPTITVPANALGANGQLFVNQTAMVTNSAGTKIYRGRYSASGGTIVWSQTASTQGAAFGMHGVVANRGATNKQVGSSYAVSGVNNGIAAVYPAVDTTAATTMVISLQRNTATDNAVLEGYAMQLLSDGA